MKSISEFIDGRVEHKEKGYVSIIKVEVLIVLPPYILYFSCAITSATLTMKTIFSTERHDVNTDCLGIKLIYLRIRY